MINTPRSTLIRQQAYIKNRLREQHRPGVIVGLGRSVQTGTTIMADFFRHALVMIGIIGLVAMAVGATTECKIYHDALNWISSFFVS